VDLRRRAISEIVRSKLWFKDLRLCGISFNNVLMF
jgi:hypothetical protein